MLEIILVKYIKPIDPEKISSFIAKEDQLLHCKNHHVLGVREVSS